MKNACEGNPAQRTKPGRFRMPREKGFDPEVEFGGGAKVRGTSQQAASKKNREARSALRGPDLAMHRAKDYYRTVKSRGVKQGIVEEEQAQYVGRPVGTAFADLTIPEQSALRQLFEQYNTIKLLRRKIYIYNKWNWLEDADKRRFSGLGLDDELPVYCVTGQEQETAYPPTKKLEVRIVHPEGFNRNEYIPLMSVQPSSTAMASLMANETMGYVIDTSDDNETVFSSETDPLSDIEPVKYPNITYNQFIQANLLFRMKRTS